jgi:two-component system, NarL family, invasion response regulator UvrY
VSGDDNPGPRRFGRSSLGQASATTHDQPIRVVTVDDHLAVRKGLELLLEDDGFHVAGAAADASHAYDLLMAARPDVAVVDLQLPGESGAELTKRVLAKLPDLRIMLYTGSEDSKLLREGLDCGARGFVLKAGPPEELMAAPGCMPGSLPMLLT